MSELTRLRIELNSLKQQVKYLLSKKKEGSKMTLGQVSLVYDDGKMQVSIYKNGTYEELTEQVFSGNDSDGNPTYNDVPTGEHENREPTDVISAYQEVVGAANLTVGTWVKCYQLSGVWYVNNLDWTTANSEDLGSGAKVDFIVDNFDRADSNDLGAYWSGFGFALRSGVIMSHVSIAYPVGFSTSAYASASASASVAIRSIYEPVAFALDAQASVSGSVGAFSGYTDVPSVDFHQSNLEYTKSLRASRYTIDENVSDVYDYSDQGAPIIQYSAQLASTSYSVLVTFMHTGETKTLPADLTNSGATRKSVTNSVATGIRIATRITAAVGGVSDSLISAATLATTGALNVCSAGASTQCSSSGRFSYVTQVAPSTIYSIAAGSGSAAYGIASVSTDFVPASNAVGLETGTASGEMMATAPISIEPTYATERVVDSYEDTLFSLDPFDSLEASSQIAHSDTTFDTATSPEVGTTLSTNRTQTHMAAGVTNSIVQGVNTMKVVVEAGSIDTYINGGLVSTVSQALLIDERSVGLQTAGAHLATQVNKLDLAQGYSGITQFKAWVGDVEPDGSESGHGDIGAGGVLDYKDGYHSTDAAGVVTYHPSALD